MARLQVPPIKSYIRPSCHGTLTSGETRESRNQNTIREIRAATHLIDPGRQIEDNLKLGPDQRHGAVPPPVTATRRGTLEQSNSITPLSRPPRDAGRDGENKAPSFRHPGPPRRDLFFFSPWDSPCEAAAEGCLAAAVRPREPMQHHGRRRTLVREGNRRAGGAGAPDVRQPASRPTKR